MAGCRILPNNKTCQTRKWLNTQPEYNGVSWRLSLCEIIDDEYQSVTIVLFYIYAKQILLLRYIQYE